MKFLTFAQRWCVVSALLIGSSWARGQIPPSHQFDPTEAPPKDIAKLLELRRPDTIAGVDRGFLQDLMKKLPRDFDPKLINEQFINDLLRNNADLNDPRKLEQLQEWVQQQMRQKTDKQQPDWKKLQDTLKKIEGVQKKQQNNAVDPNAAKNEQGMTPKKVGDINPETPKKGKKNDELAKWVVKNFGDSAAMQNMAKDLSSMMGKGKSPNLFADIQKEWKSLIGEKPGGAKEKEQSTLDKMSSGLKLPDFKSTGGSSSSALKPNDIPSAAGSAGSISDFGRFGAESWTSVVLAVLLAGAALVFWALYIRPRQKKVVTTDESASRWPVPPEDVKTREDVVKAFEHLSVSKCGAQAMNWHHIQIANQLSAAGGDRREAVARLAYLYEKARYAPRNEVFSDLEIAEARARLEQLSGVQAE